MGPLLGFLKSTKVDRSGGAKEQEMEWEQKGDEAGEGGLFAVCPIVCWARPGLSDELTAKI